LIEGLREHGYQLGRNLSVEFRSAQGQPERLPALAAELARLNVDVLVTPATPALAAAGATKSIPIVMVGTADPVATGLAASLARPGGNVTGLAHNSVEIAAKRLQLLQEAVPKVPKIAVLWNASLKSMALGYQQIEQAAPHVGVTVLSIRVTGSHEFDRAFDAIRRSQPGGLIVLFGPLRGDDLPRIVQFVTQARLPTMFELGQGVRGGGLMEFGPNLADFARRAGAYVDKLANGTKPGELPIEEPTTFELIINMRAAKSLGITIPQSLLLRADQVID